MSPALRSARAPASAERSRRASVLSARSGRVGLGGGVFQNRVLTEQVHALLTAAGFEVLIPERLPVNDAAISYGQLVEATAVQGNERKTRTR